LIVSVIVAIGEGGVIGRDGKLPWHLPDDLKRFRAITWGKPMIMGRRTFESLGRALPGRMNIVLSRIPEYRAEGCSVASSSTEALSQAATSGAPEVVVIGGAEVYRHFMQQCEKIYLTIVEGVFEGDTYFPVRQLDSPDWDVVHEEFRPADSRHAFGTRHRILIRRNQVTTMHSD
jgi:dihydrofolate reductase